MKRILGMASGLDDKVWTSGFKLAKGKFICKLLYVHKEPNKIRLDPNYRVLITLLVIR